MIGAGTIVESITPTLEIPLGKDGLFRCPLELIPSKPRDFSLRHAPSTLAALSAAVERHRLHNTWLHRASHFTSEQLGLRLHEIAGHANTQAIRAIPSTSHGFDVELPIPDGICDKCEICLESKLRRQPVKRKITYSSKPREPGYFSCDIQDHSANPGYGGYKYRVEYVCLYSGHEFTYSVKHKSGATDSLDDLDLEYPHKIQNIRMDHGGEFYGSFLRVCRQRKIHLDHVPRDSSIAFNPNAEVAHRNIDATTLCLLNRAGFTGSLQKLWPIVDKQSQVIRSYLPRRMYNFKTTPHEVIFNTRPGWLSLNLVGSRAYVVNATRSNGDHWGIIAYLLHDLPSGAKILWYPKTSRPITSKDVVIDVNHTYRTDYDADHKCLIRTKKFSLDDEFTFFNSDAVDKLPSGVTSLTHHEPSVAPPTISNRAGKRTRTTPVRFSPAEEAQKPQWKRATSKARVTSAINVFLLATLESTRQHFVLLRQNIQEESAPKNPVQALKDPVWKAAMDKELQSLEGMGVF